VKPVVITDPPRADPAVVAELGALGVATGRLREQREMQAREAFARGELGLDRYGLRAMLECLGVSYVRAGPEGDGA
jgi:4-hydroxy-4-methyl-2-oxoglutarate aldolase